MTSINKNLWLAGVLLAGCQGGTFTEKTAQTKDGVESSDLRVVKALAYGEKANTRTRGQRLVAFTFTGRTGDKVTIDVTSRHGDPVAFLLDSSLEEIATNDDAAANNTNSHLEVTLPAGTAGDATFYIAFRDYYFESRDFEVQLRGELSRTEVIELSEAKCASGRNRFLPGGEIATPEDVALDAYCGEQLFSRVAPDGFVVIFGSSRLSDGTPEYASVRSFASQWTTQRPDMPILTGGGPGIMEGGNRGAHEAGGTSIGISTYFKAADDKLNNYVTDGYMFADFATRERAMLNYAKAAIVYPGGVGTAWELFMTLSQVQTKRMNKIPLIVVGTDMGAAFLPYLQWMVAKGTVSAADLSLYQVVATPEEAVAALQAALPPTP